MLKADRTSVVQGETRVTAHVILVVVYGNPTALIGNSHGVYGPLRGAERMHSMRPTQNTPPQQDRYAPHMAAGRGRCSPGPELSRAGALASFTSPTGQLQIGSQCSRRRAVLSRWRHIRSRHGTEYEARALHAHRVSLTASRHVKLRHLHLSCTSLPSARRNSSIWLS